MWGQPPSAVHRAKLDSCDRGRRRRRVSKPIPNLCHSEPGPKPGEELAVRAVTARVERTLLSVAFDLAVAFELKGSPAGATVEERRFSAA
jgi:hypothetical protein